MELNATGQSLESQIALLAQRAQADGDDWRVKIARADSPAGRTESLATFDAVTVEMIANADMWIPPLFGGTGSAGIYYLYVMHAKDRVQGRTTAMLRLPAMAGDPIHVSKVEWAKIDLPGWPGPKTLVYPDLRSNGAAVAPGPVGTSPGTATGAAAAPLYMGRMPAATAIPPPPPGADPAAYYAQAQMAADRERLNEERRKAEIEAMRREQEQERRRVDQMLGDLRSIVKDAVARPVPVQPQTNLAETLAGLVTALSPIIAPIIASRQADAARRAEDEKRREEREAERNADMQKRQDALFEKVANQGAEVAKVMAAMSEASATMTRTMLQTMTSAIEMGLGQRPPEDDGWSGILKAGAAAFGERLAVMSSQMPTPPALPPAAQPGFAGPPRPAAPAPQPPSQPAAQPQPASRGNDVSILEALVTRVAERDPDVNGLADAIVLAIQTDPDTQNALTEANGNPIAMLQMMLGDEWAQDRANVQYAEALLTMLGQKAQAAGLVAPEPQAAA